MYRMTIRTFTALVQLRALQARADDFETYDWACMGIASEYAQAKRVKKMTMAQFVMRMQDLIEETYFS
jgi:uncharacterized protein (DUF849 family)